ncbi:MAG: hypothetical protein ILNGONEN_01196 [Syntrophorhabdaceae bacterium]|nr:hypothetical protein [Syntrophorhabdaceae bacterium]
MFALPTRVLQSTAKQMIKLHGMLQSKNIAVPINKHDWHLQGLDVF